MISSPHSETDRLFFGIPVPVEIRDMVFSLSTSISDLKWITGNDLHLTLCFIGNVSPDITQALLSFAPEDLRSGNITVLKAETKNRSKDGLIWLACDVSPSLKITQHNLVHTVSGITPLKDADRPFRPHITIARSRKHIDVKLPPFNSFMFTAEKVNLYKTVNEGQGRKYKIIRSIPLLLG